MSDTSDPKYQGPQFEMTGLCETIQDDQENSGTYSNSINNRENLDRKEYPVRKTTFGKISYVQKQS